jgi:hypothetical protein
MMPPMSRWVSCGALVALLWSRSYAHAQVVPPPPAAYASASIGLDLVLEPLATAAETDLANGSLTLALARTQTVLAEAPASSSVHVRAEGLSLLAHQRLGDAPPDAVDTDAVFAPLVAAASDDVTASRFDLARARLAWVAAHVPAQSALALRARAIGAALDARAAGAPASTAPTTTVYVPPTAGTSTWTTPVLADPTQAVTPPDDGHRPRRRQDIEIVDLYITSGLMGAYFGAWISESSGLLNGASSDDQSRILSIAMLAGAGVLTLGVFALDQIDDGPRSGQPGAISSGMRFGFVLSGLTLGLLSQDNHFDSAATFDFMGVGLIGGTALGAIFAYTAEPHPSQVQFTQTTGVWGGMLGAELGALIAPLAFPNSGATAERWHAGFGLTLGGLSAGILTGLALSAAHEHFSSRRSWLTTLGLVAGTGAGTLIWLLVSAASHWTFDLATWGGIAGAAGIGGLVLAAVLTEGDHGPRDWDEPSAVQLSFSPTVGGATIGLSGGF